MPKLHLDHVSKRYRRRESVLDDVDLILDGKEFVGLLGPSDSGKSTLLRLISGIEKASSGTIYLDGIPVGKKTPASGEVAVVFQNHALYPRMTIRENIAYSLKLHRRPVGEIQKEVEWAADLLGLTELLDQKPRMVSAEQRQVAAFARAVVRKPKIVLLDEPFTNLEAGARRRMWQMLQEVYRILDATFVYATHDPAEAMAIGTKLMILQEGRIRQWGSPQEIYACPANTFVAGLIGVSPMNFWRAKVASGENSAGRASSPTGPVYLHIQGMGQYPLSQAGAEPLLKNGYLDREIIIGVRPDQIIFQQGGPLSAVSCFYEMEGTSGYLYLESQGIQTAVRIEQECELELGKEISFDLKESDLHFFNAESGERMERE